MSQAERLGPGLAARLRELLVSYGMSDSQADQIVRRLREGW